MDNVKLKLLEDHIYERFKESFTTDKRAREAAKAALTLIDNDLYEGILDAMEGYANSRPKPLTAIELANKLFMIHSHPDIVQGTEGIVYTEEDIVKLLKELGYPDPDWEGNAAEMTKTS